MSGASAERISKITKEVLRTIAGYELTPRLYSKQKGIGLGGKKRL
jgi:hypothetical protein